MKKGFVLIARVVCVMGLASTVMAAGLEDVKSYGVYISRDGTYERVKSFSHWDVFYRHFSEIPVLKSGKEALELLVFQKDLDTNRMAFSLHPYDVLASNNPLHPIVTPVDGKKDMVKITFEEKVDHAALLEVNLSWGSDFRGMVALSDPVRELVRIYSDENQNAVGVLDSLQDILKAYPDNAQFKALVEKWTEIGNIQKDDVDYRYVTEAWKSYQEAESPSSRLQWLKKTKQEILGYKTSNPNGRHIKEADALEKEIEKKLSSL